MQSEKINPKFFVEKKLWKKRDYEWLEAWQWEERDRKIDGDFLSKKHGICIKQTW